MGVGLRGFLGRDVEILSTIIEKNDNLILAASCFLKCHKNNMLNIMEIIIGKAAKRLSISLEELNRWSCTAQVGENYNDYLLAPCFGFSVGR